MPILYSVVARQDTLLAEYSSSSGNFSTVATRILAKIALTEGSRQAYAYDRHIFNYVVSGGLVFLCMTDEKFEKRLAFAFLDDVKRRWSVTFGQRGASAARFAMNDEFARVLQKQMDFYSNDASADKLSAINKNVDEVKGIMVSNIEKVLDRQEKIELLVDKTDNLNQNAFKFKKSSTQVSADRFTPKICPLSLSRSHLKASITHSSSDKCASRMPKSLPPLSSLSLSSSSSLSCQSVAPSSNVPAAAAAVIAAQLER